MRLSIAFFAAVTVVLLAPLATAQAQCTPACGTGTTCVGTGCVATTCPGTGTPTGVPLMAGFGGPGGYGVNVLPGNDDGSTSAIDLTTAFPGGLRFFGGPYMTAYVNNNGNVTFSGPVGEYTPTPFPVASQPMIAPFWGDVDTRDGPMPTAADNLVYWDLSPGQMVVTWHNVGYYGEHVDHRMDFQMILTNALDCASGDFDVEFRYHQCDWETGDASGGSGGCGGTPAQAGFDSGDGVDFVEIPGSRTAAIDSVLCTTSNVGMPGIWQFSVRGGGVVCPGTGVPCDTGGVGACGLGVTQCIGRMTVCSPIGTSTPERCDGIDNDCNGMVDDGMDLCPTGTVCDRGVCVPPCFEHSCADGQTCTTDGICVDTACLTVTCPVGQRCVAGACVGACDAITCPHGQECVAGRCTDLCSVLTCASDEVCQDGMCIPTCPCHACSATEVCGSDGRCTPMGCDIVVCDPGLYCEGGLCLDGCAGAVCPEGQTCMTGSCVDTPDAGPPPPPPDMGTMDVDLGGVLPDGGMSADGSTVDADCRTAACHGAGRSGGCCHVAGGTELPRWAWGFALALGLVLTRRRRVR